MLLSDFIRHVLGATGTHVGCEIDGVPACLALAVQAEGADIRTVEGLVPAPDRLSRLQNAFRENYGLQCRFCTRGILMSLDALLRDRPDATEPEIRDFLSGYLCRCAGYGSIVKAALDAARKLREERERA
jgi:2-furoyl-CoA dehydrogenase 2Fe-2S iron sulfur subunit